MNRGLVVGIPLLVLFFLSPAFAQFDSLGAYVDLGHGGNDYGTLGASIPNYSEKDINLQIGLILKDILDLFGPDTYVLSRETDTTIFLIPRVYEAMGLNAKSLISVHHNGTTNPSTQYTTGLFSSLPLSDDSANNGSPGTYLNWERNTDHKLALKVALKIDQAFRYRLSDPDTLIGIRGILDATNEKTILSRTTMPSVISEASFISVAIEEENFFYDYGYHRAKEAFAIFDAWESWRLGQGFGKVDYAYAGQEATDSHKVRVHDYLNEEFSINDTAFAPYLGVWNLDQAIMLDAFNFSQNSYNYVFHHWEHKNHYDSSIISIYPNMNWVFNVDSAQDSTHWYVAYFTGGPFEIYTGTPGPTYGFVGDMNIGTLDTIQWTCDPGVEQTGEYILQLRRDSLSAWTTLDTLPFNGVHGNFLFPWTPIGPATQTAQLRFLAYDHADNKDTFVTYSFVICDGVADSDCDGINTSVDNCPSVANTSQLDADVDGDGDLCDNCPIVANANQSDVDNDSWGDVCDNCQNTFRVNQNNQDGDNYGDACDNCYAIPNNNQADSDADGWGNVCDNCVNTYNPNQSDIDNDGLGDVCDTVLNWQITYNTVPDKVAFSIKQAIGGWYILGGYRDTLTYGRQLNMCKINSIGITYEDKIFGGTGIEQGYCVRQTADSGYLSAGHSTGSGAGDMYLFKVSKTLGSPQIARYFGGTGEDAARHIELTSDGGCIIAGYTKSFGAGNSDFYIVKTNSSYDQQWYKTFGGTQADCAFSIQSTIDGGYAVAGITNSFGAGNSDMYLLKLNSNGDSIWSKTYGFTGADSLYAMKQTADKGFVLAGNTNSIGAGLTDMYVIRTDSLGNVIWTKTYGGTSYEGIRAISELPDRGFFIAGYTQSFGAGAYDFYILRTYYTGDTMWTRKYGDNNSEIAYSADLALDGGYIVAGLKYGASIDSVTFVVKDGPLEPISCCLDTTGNVDFDFNDDCNVQDLTFVIDRVFRGGPPPPCVEESDVNGDGQFCNTIDMTFLIDYFFRGGPAPSHPCDQYASEMLVWTER